MPFPERARAVSVELQNGCQRSYRTRDLPRGARKTGCHLGYEPHVIGVVVASGFKGGAGRRAKRRGMEIIIGWMSEVDPEE